MRSTAASRFSARWMAGASGPIAQPTRFTVRWAWAVAATSAASTTAKSVVLTSFVIRAPFVRWPPVTATGADRGEGTGKDRRKTAVVTRPRTLEGGWRRPLRGGVAGGRDVPAPVSYVAGSIRRLQDGVNERGPLSCPCPSRYAPARPGSGCQ